jgi:hypothetical protein
MLHLLYARFRASVQQKLGAFHMAIGTSLVKRRHHLPIDGIWLDCKKKQLSLLCARINSKRKHQSKYARNVGKSIRDFSDICALVKKDLQYAGVTRSCCSMQAACTLRLHGSTSDDVFVSFPAINKQHGIAQTGFQRT